MKLLLLTLFLSSCAVPSIMFKQDQMKAYKEASKISFISVSRDVNLVAVRDLRENKADIGHGLTGSTYSKTPIYLAHGVNAFMESYFKKAFEQRNIVVSKDSLNKLEIEIHELWVKEVIEKFKPEKAQCKANMSFKVTNTKGSWTGKKWVQFLSGGDMTDGTERLAPTLASCLNDLVEKIVNDIEFKKMIK